MYIPRLLKIHAFICGLQSEAGSVFGDKRMRVLYVDEYFANSVHSYRKLCVFAFHNASTAS